MIEPTVVDAVEIIDVALADLEACGCDPLDRAAALITSGIAEIRDSDEPVAQQLAIYRLVLEQIVTALTEVRAGAGLGPPGPLN
jgi:hypothetical protein